MIRARILAWIAWFFVNLLNWFVWVRFVNKEPVDRLVSTGEKIIYAFSHGDMVPLLNVCRNSGFLIPVSESRDGEIMAKLLKKLWLRCSARIEQAQRPQSLLELIIGMKRGKTVAISVDGPHGPLHEVKMVSLSLPVCQKLPSS